MRRTFAFLTFKLLLVLLVLVVPIVALAAQGTQPQPYPELNTLLAGLTGLASAFLIGVAKKVESLVDTAIISKLGNLTPILVTVLSIVLPKVAALVHFTGPVPDATLLVNAPVATVIAIASRELYQLVFRKAMSAAAGV